jgi:hypothetical protein
MAAPGGALRRAPCRHLHDTTTRYDRVAKLLSFLLVCTVCATARIVETLRYEPCFIPALLQPVQRRVAP